MLINNYIGATPSVIVRKVALLECLEKKQYFDNLFIAREEYDLWIRLCKKWKVAFVSEPLVKQYYRNNINRISSNVYSYVKANDLLDSKYAKDIENRLTKKERRQRLSVQGFFLGSQAIKINNSKLARKYYLEAFKTNKNIKSLLIYFACFFGAKFVVKLRCYFK